MSNKQDKPYRSSLRHKKEPPPVHVHEHHIPVEHRHTDYPHPEDPVDVPLATQPSGVGRHKKAGKEED